MRLQVGFSPCLSVAVALTVCFSLAGCASINNWRVEREVRAVWQEAHGDLQHKRALLLSEQSLSALDRVDVAVAVPAAELRRFTGFLTESLNASPDVQAQQLSFSNVSIDLADQEIKASFHFEKRLPQGAISGRINASGAVGVTLHGAALGIKARNIYLEKVSILPNWVRDDAVRTINSVLASTLAITNVVLDRVINNNPEKAVVLWFDQPKLIVQALEHFDTKKLTFVPKTIEVGMIAEASGALVTKEGVELLLKSSFVPPDEVPKRQVVLPPIDSLLEIDGSSVRRRVAAYQDALSQRGVAAFGTAFSVNTSAQPELAATKEAVSRALNQGFGQVPVQAVATINDELKNSFDLTVPIKAEDCNALINGCTYKEFCDGNRCVETITRTVQQACQVQCCLSTGFLGCILPGLCNNICNATQTVAQPIQSAACNGFRAVDNLMGGKLCNVASNLDKGFCDVEKNLKKSLCDIKEEVRRFYEHNPFATLEADAKPDVSVNATLQSASVSPNLGSLSASAVIGGGGNVEATLKYIRRLPTDAIVLGPGLGFGACTTNWDEAIKVHVSANALPFTVGFSCNLFEDTSSREVVAKFDLTNTQIVHLDMSPPPMLALFGEKPQLTMNCPAVVVSSFAVAFSEAFFTKDDMRQIMPLWTGRDYPYHVDSLGFELRIKPVTVCRTSDPVKCQTDNLLLYPHVSDKALTFVGQK